MIILHFFNFYFYVKKHQTYILTKPYTHKYKIKKKNKIFFVVRGLMRSLCLQSVSTLKKFTNKKKSLLYFILSIYSVFCILPNRVQNRAMYSSFFIIIYNVYFLRDDVNFLDKKVCTLYMTEGKKVI